MTEQDNLPEVTIVDRAENISKELDNKIKKAEEIYKQNQALVARDILGGQTNGGEPAKEKKEISNREYALSAERGIILK